jgi:hypothetical protein
MLASFYSFGMLFFIFQRHKNSNNETGKKEKEKRKRVLLQE